MMTGGRGSIFDFSDFLVPGHSFGLKTYIKHVTRVGGKILVVGGTRIKGRGIP